MSDKSYNNHMHRVGRVFMAMGLSVMLMVPVLIWVISGVGPDWNQMIIAILSMSILYLPSGIIEVVTYSPFLGTGATYLAFVPGNLVNLKIPCVMNAREIAKTEIGSPENEVVATLSVAFSTITTVVILSVGILFLQLIRPFLEAEVMQPAFNWVVSALFGALGYKYFLRNPKLVIVPIVFSLVLAAIAPKFVYGNIAIVIVITAVVSVVAAKIMYDKKWLSDQQ